MHFKNKTHYAVCVIIFLLGVNIFAQIDYSFNSPSDDRWQYPFNGTPGTRNSISLFALDDESTSIPTTFNYRDGVGLFRWDTSQITAGLDPSQYQFDAVRVTIWHNAGEYVWDTRTSDTIELFGMGNNDAATSADFTLDTWTETSVFYGGNGVTTGTQRNPHPLNIDDLATTQNVEDLVDAIPWATGDPVYGTGSGEYLPNTNVAERFPIHFTLNIANARVKRYIQDELSTGRMSFVISTNVPAAGQSASGFPSIVTKEVLGGQFAASLDIEGLVLAKAPVKIGAPSDDRWQYPFNGTPGFRDTAALFAASSFPFNYRDGVLLLRFNTSSALDSLTQIATDVESVRVIAYNTSGTFSFETTDHNPSTTTVLEIFGVGNDDTVTSNLFTRSSWTESSPYIGGTFGGGPPPGPIFQLRQPHALNISDIGFENVHENPAATPWGTGSVVAGIDDGKYTPNQPANVPFPITYELDLNVPRVKQYVLDELNSGRIMWLLSTNIIGSQTMPDINPQILTKEGSRNLVGTNLYAPCLIIEGLQVELKELTTGADRSWGFYY